MRNAQNKPGGGMTRSKNSSEYVNRLVFVDFLVGAAVRSTDCGGVA